jgi:drug/metabolite transporter (DMT)-like permease
MLAAIASIWGASYLLIKVAVDEMSPAMVVFGRTALATVVLLIAVRLQGPQVWTHLSDVRRRPVAALLLGVTAIAAPFMLISYGELAVPSGLTAVLIAPASLFVALLAPFIDRSETIGRRAGVGLVIGLVGVALVVGLDSVGSAGEFLGALAIVGASISYALASFVVKGLYRETPAIVSSLISVAVGALISLPVAAASAPREWPGAVAILCVAALGVVGTALAFVIFYRLITEAGAGKASLVSYLVPGAALLYGAAILDEAITPAAIAGLVLIVGGVALAAWPSAQPQAPAPAGEGAIGPSGP